MRYLQNFDKYARVLEIDHNFAPVRTLRKADLPEGSTLSTGFFVDFPAIVAVVATKDGPALIAPQARVLLGSGSKIDLIGTGPDRVMNVVPTAGQPIQIAAPETDAVDVNDPDDRESVDFFLWLRNRILMEHVQKAYTL